MFRWCEEAWRSKRACDYRRGRSDLQIEIISWLESRASVARDMPSRSAIIDLANSIKRGEGPWT